MVSVRVFIPTYNRHDLFPRAIKSLLNQTFINWSAEVHNDLPNDPFPSKFIRELNDTRFKMVDHPNNIGAVSTFNLFFRNDIKEDFICILEDDNWLEPLFIEEMVTSMEKYKTVKVAFSNHYLWQELPNNQWEKLPNLKYPITENKFNFITFPDLKHVSEYHFSNCSVFFRNTNHLEKYKIPAQTRGDFMEHVRERAFPHPILFVNTPLANFSLTLQSYRKNTLNGYHEHEALLLASFLNNIKPDQYFIKQLLIKTRQGFGLGMNKIIYAALIDKESRFLLKELKPKEYFLFALYNIRHLSNFPQVLKAKSKYKDLWNYLDLNTSKLIDNDVNN